MKIYLTMPKPGETIREGLVVQWLKKAGDAAQENDPLVELETEKAVFTYESPFRGTLQEILISEGKGAAVGVPIALFEVSEEDGKKYLMLGVGRPVVGEERGERREEKKEIRETQKVSPEPLRHSPQGYSPLIRNLAREHNLTPEELAKIPHTGPGGRLTKEDVLGYVKKNPPQPPFNKRGDSLHPSLQRGVGGDFERVSISPIRKRIAERMERSKNEIPHAACGVDVDFTAIMEYRKKEEAAFQKKFSISLTPFYFFLYAVRENLKKYPSFNASFVEENNDAFIRRFSSMNFAVAVATPQGLFNPVIHKAENSSFSKLAEAASNLEKKAKEGKLSVEESTGATFVVNNPGAFGGSRCYQIIPSPLGSIVGMNRIQDRPWVVEGKIVPRKIAEVDMSFDHRLFDGAEVIQFLESLKKILENFPFESVTAS